MHFFYAAVCGKIGFGTESSENYSNSLFKLNYNLILYIYNQNNNNNNNNNVFILVFEIF